MRFKRSSGILLHPTSLPGRFGIGELGPEAYRFADFLDRAGQRVWQVLPLGPPGYGHSPYTAFSAFAGNPLLISLDNLAQEGWLSSRDLDNVPSFPAYRVDFDAVRAVKEPLLRKAAETFRTSANAAARDEFARFCDQDWWWVDDYALFMSLSEANGRRPWNAWAPDLVARAPRALDEARTAFADEVYVRKFWQYVFFRQWRALKEYCNQRDIRILGDVPIYVAHDSVDVWANPHMFYLDDAGNPTVVAGVPPDYFAKSGQLWGNPLYRWDALEAEHYHWWIERLRMALRLADMIRVDHFRGFSAYWEVDASEATAENGRWRDGPGAAFFDAVRSQLGDVPIVAENLGVITDDVEELRRQFGFPGMAVLQFAFGPDIEHAGLLPHAFEPNTVAYTGTHDNNTTLGWWQSGGRDSTRSIKDARKTKAFAKKYLNTTGRDIHWACIRTVHASVADTAIVPLQDVLGLDSDARMNSPGVASEHNWRWRYAADMLTDALCARLRDLTETYGRLL